MFPLFSHWLGYFPFSNFIHSTFSLCLGRMNTYLQALCMYTSPAVLFPAIPLTPAASGSLAPKLFSPNQETWAGYTRKREITFLTSSHLTTAGEMEEMVIDWSCFSPYSHPCPSVCCLSLNNGLFLQKSQCRHLPEQSDPGRVIWHRKEHRWMLDGAFLGFLTIWRRTTTQFRTWLSFHKKISI